MPETLPAVERAPMAVEGAGEEELFVLLVGFGGAELEDFLAPGALPGAVEAVGSAEEALAVLGRRAVAVLCTGPLLPVEQTLEILAAEREGWPQPAPLTLVLAGGSDPLLFQDWIAEDRVFYLSQRYPGTVEALNLLANTGERVLARRSRRAAPEPPAAKAPSEAIEPGELLRRLALQGAPAERAEVLAEAARDSIHADRAYCLLYDAKSDQLWTRDPGTGGERRRKAAFGVSGFVLRSGLPVALPRAALDPRYDKISDDPEGDGTERFLAVPVLAPTGRATAVLVAVRDGGGGELRAEDREILEQLAEHAGPHLAPPPEAKPAETEGEAEIPKALATDPLTTTPGWARKSYWILLGILGASLLASVIFNINEYAPGPAVVWLGDRIDVTNPAAGTVEAVTVDPGQPVVAGQTLVRFNGEQERAELARLEGEFTLQLLKRLRDPDDPSTGQSLISLRAQRDLARARFGERSLVAPIAGTVADVRVRPGQLVSPGQAVASITRGQVRPSLLIFLPGEYRPRLRPGMRLRLELTGYPYHYLWLTVDEVGEDVVGPAEALRYLGPEISDGVKLERPVVTLTARLPDETFEVSGRRQRFHNGMLGTAEVQVKSEKILLTLVPGLKTLFENEDG